MYIPVQELRVGIVESNRTARAQVQQLCRWPPTKTASQGYARKLRVSVRAAWCFSVNGADALFVIADGE